MRKLLIIILFAPGFLLAQTSYWYKDTCEVADSILYTIKDGVVYPEDQVYPSRVVISLNYNNVYIGTSELESDVIFTIRGNKVYSSKSTDINDLIFTIRNGIVYKGDSKNHRDIYCTFKDRRIYNKDLIYDDEVLASYTGVATMNDIIMMIYLITFNPQF